MPRKDIVVIGGSTGSGRVLKQLMRSLPHDLPASLFITTHIPTIAPSHLAEMLRAPDGMPIHQALDGQPIERRQTYVAVRARRALVELYEGRAEQYRRYAHTLREAAVLAMCTGRNALEQPE